MKHVNLATSPVVFNEEEHTYTYNGRQLCGITAMIKKQIFPDKYAGVPDSVLRKAASRGTAIHQEIQMHDMGFPPECPSPELMAYKNIKQSHRLDTIAGEYTVSDLRHFASNIDLVMQEHNGDVSLADIKTTYNPDIEYVRWQLSIYAYLFELQNPKIKIKRLYLIWLRGENSLFEPVKRIETGIVKELLRAETEGRRFHNPLPQIGNPQNIPKEITDAEQQLAKFEQQLRSLKQQKEQLMEGLLTLMRDNGIKSYKGQHVQLTRKKAACRESIDTARLKKEMPDIYNEYKKTTQIKESLTLNLI